jgi:hypothetical protein
MRSRGLLGLAAVLTLLAWTSPLLAADWTVMIYLDGDNPDENAAIDRFLEIASVGSSAEVNVLVQLDRSADQDDRFGNWAGAKRFLVTSNMTPTAENAVKHLGRVDMGNPAALSDFVVWAKTNYPASHSMLILSSSDFEFWVGEHGDRLWLDLVHDALSTSGSVTLLGLDCNVLGGLELAYELKDLTDVLVGPELLAQLDGWPYGIILANLVFDPQMDAKALGTAIINAYGAKYLNVPATAEVAIDMAKVPALASAVNGLAGAMLNHYSDADQTPIQSVADSVVAAVQDAVLAEFHDNQTAGAHGVAVFFPGSSEDYLGYKDLFNYDALAFALDTQWNEFLNDFYADMAGSAISVARARTYRLNSLLDPFCIDLQAFVEALKAPPKSAGFYQQEMTDSNSFEAVGEAQGWRADDNSWGYSLPFSFPYFGTDYSSLCVSSNGYVDLLAALDECYAGSFESPTLSTLLSSRRIAPLWMDLVTDGSSQEEEDIYIDATDERVIIRWIAQSFLTITPINVEAVLFADGIIEFRYGSGNLDLDPFRKIGISNGDTVNYYLAPYDPGVNAATSNLNMAKTVRYIPPTLTLEVVGGHGTVSADPPGSMYARVETVTLTATPDSNYAVKAWTGTDDDTSTDMINTVTMDTQKHVAVEFVRTYHLTASVVGGHGTIEPTQGTYVEGAGVMLTATPDEGYRLKAWHGTDADESKAITNMVTMTDDKEVAVEFVRMYHLTASVVGGHGTIEPTQGTYVEGAGVMLTATPDEGYRLKAWHGTDADESKALTNTVTMTSDKTVTVQFEPVTFVLNASVTGGHGTVSVLPAATQYAPGTVVTLTATPHGGYHVKAWHGTDDDTSVANINTVKIDQDRTVTVEFTEIIPKLTAAVDGDHGTLIVNPDLPNYAYGAIVQLTAKPNEGYRVAAWIGTDNDSSKENANTVTLRSDRNVIVKFTLITGNLSLGVVGGHGTLTADPAGPSYNYGTLVNLVATPESGYRVKAWSGTDNDTSKENISTVKMTNTDRSVTVEFEPILGTLSTIIKGGSGVVRTTPEKTIYNHGEVVTLTAIPDFGYRVKQWQGTDDDTSTYYRNTVTMTSGKTVTVVLAQLAQPAPPVMLDVTVIGGHGSVEPPGGTFDVDTVVALEAKPDAGYRVNSWSGTDDDNSMSTTNSVTMDESKTVSVAFEAIELPPGISTGCPGPGLVLFLSLFIGLSAITHGGAGHKRQPCPDE